MARHCSSNSANERCSASSSPSLRKVKAGDSGCSLLRKRMTSTRLVDGRPMGASLRTSSMVIKLDPGFAQKRKPEKKFVVSGVTGGWFGKCYQRTKLPHVVFGDWFV